MPVTLDDMMRDISPERRAKIGREAARIVAESRSLAELRKAVGMTQQALAKQLDITQASLSEIETKEDTKVSTLARIVEGLGGKLRFYAEMPGGVQIPLALGREDRAAAHKENRARRPRRMA